MAITVNLNASAGFLRELNPTQGIVVATFEVSDTTITNQEVIPATGNTYIQLYAVSLMCVTALTVIAITSNGVPLQQIVLGQNESIFMNYFPMTLRSAADQNIGVSKSTTTAVIRGTIFYQYMDMG